MVETRQGNRSFQNHLYEWLRLLLVFFFSSRRRHTRCSRDWSSDVCSSDLEQLLNGLAKIIIASKQIMSGSSKIVFSSTNLRSEERRVGKECRSRWSPYH